MPARGRVADAVKVSDIPLSVLIDIARDPAAYEAKLEELDARKEAAKAAEAEHVEATERRRAELHALADEVQSRQSALDLREHGLDERAAEHERQTELLAVERQRLQQRANDLADLSTRLDQMGRAATATEERLVAAAEQQRATERKLADLAAQLDARDHALTIKENRIKALAEGL